MDQRALKVLRDVNQDILDRIKAGSKLELDFWKDRSNPPNLSKEEFRRVLPFMNRSSAIIKFSERKSLAGANGRLGEDEVFKINFFINRGQFRFEYFLKGYFFEKNNLKGLCVQSFRLLKKHDQKTLRIIK